MTKLKFLTLRHPGDKNYPKIIEVLGDLEEYPRIHKDWDKGWQDLGKKGDKIIGKLREI